jgi:N-ethylmaleimide reductase
VPYEIPRALETGEIPGVVDAYRQGAVNAQKAASTASRSTAPTAI